jgi:RNA polymerase sigma-70 factor, ECF subfamily
MEPLGADPLIAALAAGDPCAFAALYDRFGQRLFRTALTIVRQREDAEDAVQEVFMSIVKTRRNLTNVRDLTAYLFAALRRAAGRRAACRPQERLLSQSEVGDVPAVAGKQDGSTGLDDRLQRALLSLPDEQREVVALKIDGELTFAQIAAVVGVSVNTAASRYRYALEKLRAILEARQ